MCTYVLHNHCYACYVRYVGYLSCDDDNTVIGAECNAILATLWLNDLQVLLELLFS